MISCTWLAFIHLDSLPPNCRSTTGKPVRLLVSVCVPSAADWPVFTPAQAASTRPSGTGAQVRVHDRFFRQLEQESCAVDIVPTLRPSTMAVLRTFTQPLLSNRAFGPFGPVFHRANLALVLCLSLAKGGTSTPLASHYANDVNYYEISNEERSDPLEKFYLIREQRWHTDTVLPIPLLPSTEGMSARSHHR
ncbi:uncharacterized protein LOC113464925 isoform X1 [Ceratina calcarata]|uniref:Uncharacterized protein LOC113464925 isoform X1 n=1 Tax=Ceratina calcarata TaxID=156304 RepID=A0AAJ7SA35_9HYME|nr:uncharacterized protein LOC113464925 isoform X1 [Ceratina calcarata]